MANSAAERGRKVLIMVHRQELLSQASETLNRIGLEHGIIAPGYYGETRNVAVASVQTLQRRLMKGPLHYDFIIVDEAHLYMAKTFLSVIQHFPRAHFLSCTATPARLDSQGLGVSSGGFCDDLILGPSVKELINQGFLVRPEIYAPPIQFSLEDVRRSKGDYVTSQLEGKVNKPTVTGSAVEHYAKLAPGEPAIVFCVSRKHAEEVAQEFRAAHFTAEVVHGGLDKKTRAERLAGIASGRIQVLTSVDLLTTGTDIPCLSVGIFLRPTSSLTYWLQSCGRILRPFPGKKRALLLDHVGNFERLGAPQWDREWSLEGEKKSKAEKDEVLTVRQCDSCFYVFSARTACPQCGATKIGKPRKVQEIEGELAKIEAEELETRMKKDRRRERGWEESQCRTIEDWQSLARARGHKQAWAFMRFKNMKPRRH